MTDFGGLDERLCRVIVGLARRFRGLLRGQNVWTWEDLVQAGIVGALVAAAEYDSGRGNTLDAWAFYRVREQMINLSRTGYYSPSRHAAREPLESLWFEPQGEPDTPDLSPLLDTLTPKQRAAVELFYGLGGPRQSAREIAAVRGVSKETVESAVRQALVKMRTHGHASVSLR